MRSSTFGRIGFCPVGQMFQRSHDALEFMLVLGRCAQAIRISKAGCKIWL
jgi:hypothetical protein